MYDGATQLFVDNPIDRHLLNSTMTEDFRFNDDGSLALSVPGQLRAAEAVMARLRLGDS